MFGNWQQLGLGAVPPPFFAQPNMTNMMYPLYPGAQEATATSGQPHQWNTGGQLPPMVFPSLNPLSVVASTASALEQHTNTAAAGSVSNILASAGCPPVPPLPSNPAPPKPPAPPTEEKPPLPPDPPPPDEDSKQKLTAKNPEEERRMEKLKQQAAQWQQQKKQIDDAAAQQQLQFQLQQQQQFHQMWLAAAQYMTPPAADLMAALPPSHPPLPPVTVPTLPQHTKPPPVPSVAPRSTVQSNIPVSATVQSNTPAPVTATAASIVAAATITSGSVPSNTAAEKVAAKPAPVWNKPSTAPKDKDFVGAPPYKTDSGYNQDDQLQAVVKEEEEFERQYNDWKKQYDEWRIQNKDHPDRQQFKQYENQFLEIEAKMAMKRRDIQNRKHQIELNRGSSNFQNAPPRFDTSFTSNRDGQYPKANQNFQGGGMGGRVGIGGGGTAGGCAWPGGGGGGGGGRAGILGTAGSGGGAGMVRGAGILGSGGGGGGGGGGPGILGSGGGGGPGILGNGGGGGGGGGGPGILGSGGAAAGGGVVGWGRGAGILGGGGGGWAGRGGVSGAVGVGNSGVGRSVGAGIAGGLGGGAAAGGVGTGVGAGVPGGGIGAGVTGGGGTGVGRGGAGAGVGGGASSGVGRGVGAGMVAAGASPGAGRGIGAGMVAAGASPGAGRGIGAGMVAAGTSPGAGRGIGAGKAGDASPGAGRVAGPGKAGEASPRGVLGVGTDGTKGGPGVALGAGSDNVKGGNEAVKGGGARVGNVEADSKQQASGGGGQTGKGAEESKSPVKEDNAKTPSVDTPKDPTQSNFSSQDFNKDKDTSIGGATSMDIGPPGANNNRFGGPNRFDSSRNQFEGSQFPMGPGQGGRYGMRNEEPDHNVERQGMNKNFSFMDSDMRTQGPNQNPQFPGFPRGPPPDDRGFGRGPPGFNFNQGPRGGPRFNQGPPFGPGFNQGPPRGPPNQNRPMLDPGDNRMGPREMENVDPFGFPSQRRREPSPNRQSSENQFGCFPPRDNTAWAQENSGMAKNQPMPNRSLDGKNDKMEVPLKGSGEPSAKIPRKDDDKSEAGVGKLEEQQWPKQDSDNSSNEQRNLKDGPQDFQNNKMPMKNDNWGQLDPGQPSGDQGPNFRNRGQQQPSPGPPQFERPPFKGPWGPQMQRMGPGPGPGPGFNVNMQAGGPPPPPRMLINIRPEFNPRMCPPGGGGGGSGVGGGGTGPPYREMMMRDGGVGPPFRGDKEGEQFSEGPGDNRPEGRMPPDCRPNSMGFPKNRDGNMDFPGADEREIMAMGSARRGRGGMMMALRGGFPGRPNLQQRDCHDMNFPNMNRDDGNCRPDSLRNDAPPFNWSGEPRMSSKNQLDSWMNRDRAQWEDNRCDFGNNNNNNNNKSNNSNKPWGHPQGSPAPPGRDRDMDPAFHKISNPDFYDPMNRVNRLGDMNNRLYNADRCNRPPPAAMPPSRDFNHNRFNSSSSDQQFWNERDRNFPPKEFDVQRGNRHPNERFHRGDFLPPYGETIDYAHRPAREMFEPDSDLARNKPPAVFDYGHKHANYLGRPDPSRDMDFQGNKNLPPDHMRGDRGRMFPENEHGPFQGNWLRDGDRPRNCDKEDMMRDMERMRNRDRDIDLRDRDCRDRDRDRGRPIAHDSRERERLRERDKFRDGQGDREGYLRGREHMDEEDKWADRKHDDRKYDRDCRGRYNSPNRGYHNTEPPHIRDAFPKSQLPSQPETKAEVVSADDLLCKPGRDKRPHQVVVIIRGLPGSGKTYVSKLIRDKETNNGGPAPRMLCMDDYFMVEVEKVEKDSESNKMIKKKVLQYEYEPDLEETYRQSILKSFKKTIDDGFFPFIIYDSVNEKVRHFEEFWSYAKSKGFQVYVATVHSDVSTCIKRNIHGRTKQDINKIHKNWEETPKHHIHLDIRCLLQDAAIPEVEMEDTSDEKTKKDATPQKGDAEEEDEPIGPVGYIKSKWEIDVGDQTGQVNDQVLDKLDGIRFGKRRRSASPIFSLDDYLQLDGYRTRQTIPGKKRVRWADMEERKQQLRRRELGFVVGQTQHDWDKITDDSYADRALNRTKYI